MLRGDEPDPSCLMINRSLLVIAGFRSGRGVAELAPLEVPENPREYRRTPGAVTKIAINAREHGVPAQQVRIARHDLSYERTRFVGSPEENFDRRWAAVAPALVLATRGAQPRPSDANPAFMSGGEPLVLADR